MPRPQPVPVPSPAPSGAAALPAVEAFPRAWRWHLNLVVLFMATVAVRLHEVVPKIAFLRPVLVVTALVVWRVLVGAGAERRAFAMRDWCFILCIGYFGWGVAMAPFALWVGLSVHSLQQFAPAILLVLTILMMPPTQRVVNYLLAGFVGATALYAVGLMVMGKEIIDDRMELGASLDANDLACIFALALPLALGFMTRTSGIRRVLALAAAAMMGIALVATGSRGGTLALLVGVTVFVLGFRGGKKFLLLIGMAAGLYGLWLVATPTYRARITDLVEGKEDYNYTEYAGRKQIWQRGRIYIKENLITGVGAGNFTVAEGNYLDRIGERGKWSAPHNTYLQAFAELGVPGGTLFMVLLGLTVLRAVPFWRAPPHGSPMEQWHRPELLAALLAFMAGAYFLSLAYFYALFAMVALVALASHARTGPRAGLLTAPSAPASPYRRGVRFTPAPLPSGQTSAWAPDVTAK